MSKNSINKETNDHTDNKIVSFDTDGNPYSYYSEDKWYLWSLNFNVSFSRLSGAFKVGAKKIVYNLLNETTLNSKKSSIENLLAGAATFERCIKACGGKDYSFIDNDRNYRLFLEEAKKIELKYKTWKNNFIFIKHAHKEKLINRNIDNFEKLSIYLAPNGEAYSQSVCLPEKIASAYYSEALNFVDKLHPHRHQISKAYDEYTTEYARLITKSYTAHTCIKHSLKNIEYIPSSIDITFDYSGGWLSKLRGACYIVIAAFTGCRDSEIKSFNINSYQEKNMQVLLYLFLMANTLNPMLEALKERLLGLPYQVLRKLLSFFGMLLVLHEKNGWFKQPIYNIRMSEISFQKKLIVYF